MTIGLRMERIRPLFARLFCLFAIASSAGCFDSEDAGDTLDDSASQLITYSAFRDTNPSLGILSGEIQIKGRVQDADSLTLVWVDQYGNAVGEPWLEPNENGQFHIEPFDSTPIPVGATSLLAYVTRQGNIVEPARPIRFHDFIGNTQVSGPGGNEQQQWEYGVDRAYITVNRAEAESTQCIFDNGLVSVIDMNNGRDSQWEAGVYDGPNPIDDMTFPPYAFFCDSHQVQPIPNHDERPIVDEVGVWTYSTMNDAMYYGTHVYDTFLKYLGEPPLNEKIRLRIHYGNPIDVTAFWDGHYANFSDGYLTHYSLATLDIIAHEIAHGVLSRISGIDPFKAPISVDAKTLHEAFGDISGVMAKHELNRLLNTQKNIWTHGEESNGWVRQLDQIVTEEGAITSYANYADAQTNPYLRIGMITYPFHRLSEVWGLEQAYEVYLHSARHCWHATINLQEVAQCVGQSSVALGLNWQVAKAAFDDVGIAIHQ